MPIDIKNRVNVGIISFHYFIFIWHLDALFKEMWEWTHLHFHTFIQFLARGGNGLCGPEFKVPELIFHPGGELRKIHN